MRFPHGGCSSHLEFGSRVRDPESRENIIVQRIHICDQSCDARCVYKKTRGAAGNAKRGVTSGNANNRRKRAMPFIKGRSGNPRGRPVGARGKKTLAREAAMRAKAAAEAQAMVDRWLGTRGRALLRVPRPARLPPARLPADALPHDTQSAAAAVATLLGTDAASVMEAVGLTGGEAADWFDDA
jgi:hypothetical protein